MSNNTPDYEDNIVFEPQGDQSDARVVFHTDRTALTIKLIEEIERLKAENDFLDTECRKWSVRETGSTIECFKLKELLKECRNWLKSYRDTHSSIKDDVNETICKIDEALK